MVVKGSFGSLRKGSTKVYVATATNITPLRYGIMGPTDIEDCILLLSSDYARWNEIRCNNKMI